MVAALRPLLADPELRTEFARRGRETIQASGQAELAASIRAETLRWAPRVRPAARAPMAEPP